MFQKYQTDRHEWEKAEVEKKGYYAHERAKNDSGYLSLRNTKEYDSIGQIMRLDNWVAKGITLNWLFDEVLDKTYKV